MTPTMEVVDATRTLADMDAPMTDEERFSLKDYMRERFDSIDARLTDIHGRLESLEADRDQQIGRNNFIRNAAKAVAGAAAFVLAALGIKSQVS